VQDRVKPKRLTHILGVRDFVTELAATHDVDPAPLRIAALLHDSERDIPQDRMVPLAKEYGIRIRPEDINAPILLHGPLAAEIGKREWGIKDPTVLTAVRYHTSGHPDMSYTDMIFYLADGLEPNRDFPGVEPLRKIAHKDVRRATRLLLENSITYIRAAGKRVDPDALALRARFEAGRSP
jgi:predicted HD superfamily hydrolase involved in NAD metabolism